MAALVDGWMPTVSHQQEWIYNSWTGGSGGDGGSGLPACVLVSGVKTHKGKQSVKVGLFMCNILLYPAVTMANINTPIVEY